MDIDVPAHAVYVQSLKFRPVVDPEKLHSSQKLNFSYVFGKIPEIKKTNYMCIDLPIYTPKTTKSHLEHTINTNCNIYY